MIGIAELWQSDDPIAWNEALVRYWEFVTPGNLAIELRMESLDLRGMLPYLDAQRWYEYLKNDYFRWKYTAANRYATTTKSLRWYLETDNLAELDCIKERLLTFEVSDIREGLSIAKQIKGLGIAGGSGLLALLYPNEFGTVDQFAVKALCEVNELPERSSIIKMNPTSLSLSNGVVLIDIFRRKAEKNNRLFRTAAWTPRKIDKILWTYGRPSQKGIRSIRLCRDTTGKSKSAPPES